MPEEVKAKGPIWHGVFQTCVASLAIFAGWCAIDYYEVNRSDYPDTIHQREWLILVLPILAFASSYWVGRQWQPKRGIGYSVVITLLSIPISIPLILLFGVWFHFAIGGTL